MLHWLLSNAVATLPFVLALLIAQRLITARPGVWNALWVIALVRLILPPIIDWPWSLSLPAAQPVVERIVETDEMLFQKAWMLATLPDDALAVVGEPLPEAIPAAPFPWLKLLLGLWAFGAFVLLVRASLGVRRFNRIAREGIPADSFLNDEVEVVAGRLRCRKPGVRVLAGILSPLVWALGKPTLYWPFGLEYRLGETGRRAVLTHELAHVKRRDHWVRRLEMFTALLHWWNPLFWIIRAQVRRTGELACDWWVVQTQPNQRRAYAEALLEVCRGWSPDSAPAVGIGTGGVKELERRLTMIMRSTGSQKRGKRAAIAVGLLGALALPGWSWGKPDETKNVEWELLAMADDKASGEAQQLFTLFRRTNVDGSEIEYAVGADEPKVKQDATAATSLKWIIDQNKGATAKWEDLANGKKELLDKLKAAEAEFTKLQAQIQGMDPRTKQGAEGQLLVANGEYARTLVELLHKKIDRIDEDLKNQKAVVLKWNASIADQGKTQNIDDSINGLKAHLADKSATLGNDHPEIVALKRRLEKLVELRQAKPVDSTEAQLRTLQDSLDNVKQKLGEAHPETVAVRERLVRQVETLKKARAEVAQAEAAQRSLAARYKAQAEAAKPDEAQQTLAIKAYTEALVKANMAKAEAERAQTKTALDAGAKEQAQLKAELDAVAKKYQAAADNARAEAAKAMADAEKAQAMVKARGRIVQGHALPAADATATIRLEGQPLPAAGMKAAVPVEGFKIETKFVGPDGKEIKGIEDLQGLLKLAGKDLLFGNMPHGAIKVEGKIISAVDGKEVKVGEAKPGTVKVEGKLLTTDGKAPVEQDRILLWSTEPGTKDLTFSGTSKLFTQFGENAKPGETKTITIIMDEKGNVTQSNVAGKPGETKTITLTMDGKGNVLQSNVSGKPLGLSLALTDPAASAGNMVLGSLSGAPAGQAKDVLFSRVNVDGKTATFTTQPDGNAVIGRLATVTDSSVQTLERGTYKLPGKAEAVAKFIKENVKAKNIEITSDKDTFTVTADPATQRIIGQFLSLLNPKISQPKPSPVGSTFFYANPAATEPSGKFELRAIEQFQKALTPTAPAAPLKIQPVAPPAPPEVKMIEAPRTAPAAVKPLGEGPIKIELKLADAPKAPPAPATPRAIAAPARPADPAGPKPAVDAPKATTINLSRTAPAEKGVETKTEVIAISAGKMKENAEKIEKLLKEGFTMKMDKNGDLVLEKTTKSQK